MLVVQTVPHVFVDSAGESHCGSMDVTLQLRDLAAPMDAFFTSDPMPAKHCVFFQLPPRWQGPQHVAPRHQLFVCLAGEVRFVTSDGDICSVKAGDSVMVSDTTGKGRLSEVVSDGPARGVIIQFD